MMLLMIIMWLIAWISLITSKNLLKTVLSVESMVLVSQLTFVALGYDSLLQSFLIYSLMLTIVSSAAFLLLLYYSKRRFGGIDVKDFKNMRW